jgi:hypothetical protein
MTDLIEWLHQVDVRASAASAQWGGGLPPLGESIEGEDVRRVVIRDGLYRLAREASALEQAMLMWPETRPRGA